MTDSRPSTLQAFLLAFGSVFFLVGCSSSAPTADNPEIPDGFPNHSSDEIRHQILGSTDTVHAYRAKARVTVQSPDQNRTFNAVVRHRRADSLFMRVSLFGMEGGRLLLTPDSVFFYDTRKGILRAGPVDAVREFFPAPVSSDQFFANMLGVLAPAPRPTWTVEADSSLYYFSDSSGRERYTVDPTHWRVVRYEEESPTGTVLHKRVFSDFQPVDGVLLPAQLIFHRPASNLRAIVKYQDVDLNPSNLSLTLDVPSQVPRKPFR